MKKLIALAVILAAAGMGGPAHADTPIALVCKGTGGYLGSTWRFQDDRLDLGEAAPNSCSGVAADSMGVSGVPPQDPEGAAFWALRQNLTPVVSLGSGSLTGGGTFACGNGSLSGSGSLTYAHNGLLIEPRWDLTWTATFIDGVGLLAGMAEQTTGQTRTLSGVLLVDDGAAVGQCDDSAGNSQVIATFVLS